MRLGRTPARRMSVLSIALVIPSAVTTARLRVCFRAI